MKSELPIMFIIHWLLKSFHCSYNVTFGDGGIVWNIDEYIKNNQF